MITASNYFEGSIGTFRLCPNSWAEQARRSFRLIFDQALDEDGYPCRVFSTDCSRRSQGVLVLGNRHWYPNFVSYSARYGSFSAYWTSLDSQWLLRLSDHWSEGPSGVHLCGNIRQCYWRIDPGSKPQKGARFWLGIVKLSELRPR